MLRTEFSNYTLQSKTEHTRHHPFLPQRVLQSRCS
jgi:hypothetical protein